MIMMMIMRKRRKAEEAEERKLHARDGRRDVKHVCKDGDGGERPMYNRIVNTISRQILSRRGTPYVNRTSDC